MKLVFHLLLFIVCTIDARSSDRPEKMTVSVIVPCHYVHFPLLTELLSHLAHQTVLPSEVVISLSECDKIPDHMFRSFEQEAWPFCVKLLRSQNKLSAGQNRNRACAVSTGDLLICQDADDTPHPQRVEIIRYVFEHHRIDHLMHFWILPHDKFAHYDPKEFDDLIFCSNNYEESVNYYGKAVDWNVTNGNVAMTRRVFEKIQWPSIASGEDESFNKEVYKVFKNTVVVTEPLLIYRNQLSSFHASTYPYLSGDTFRAFSDFIIDEVNLPFSPESVKKGSTIFVQTQYLSNFFNRFHPRIAAPYILITHNSPLSIPGNFASYLDDNKLIAWFGPYAASISHPKLHALPVGIANRGQGRGALFERIKKQAPALKNTLLFIKDPAPQDLEAYLTDLENAKYALCLTENGMDDPTVWEALYLGTIPLLISPSLPAVYEGLPVITLKSLKELSESYIEQNYQKPNINIAQLGADYWFKLIESFKPKVDEKQ